MGALSHDVVLVLDDYHLISNVAIHDGLAFMIEHLAPPMHLVMTGRADPPLPLARMRSRGELAELRAADLRFKPDEAATFLNEAMGLRLSAHEVAVLDARTEGWIAGLQLAGLSMQGREDVSAFIAAFTGDDRYIVDYLVEEVLERQPDDVRGFLLQTSILERLNGPLCDAVTGGEGGRGVLEDLERGNLFVVPLDDSRQWYRYHRLFADVLQAHLIEERPDQVCTLDGRASWWFEEHAQPSDAIRHALAANEVVRAAGLIELAAEAYVRAHQPDRLLDWLRPIPDDVIQTMPVLSTFYALALQGVGEIHAAESRLNDAERRLRQPTMVVVDEAGLQSLPSRLALGRSYGAMASGDVARSAELARSGLELLKEDEHHWRGAASSILGLAHWATGDLAAAEQFHAAGVASLEQAGDIVLALSSAYHGGNLLRARGRLSEAKKDYERSLQLGIRAGGPTMPGLANLHFGLSELYCELGDTGAAARHLLQGEELGNSAALPATPYRRCLARARLLQSQGDLAGALEVLDQAEPLIVRGAVPDIRPIAAMRTRLWLAQGRVPEASEWARAQDLSVEDVPVYALEFLHTTFARVLIAEASRERDARSLRVIDRLLAGLCEAAEAGGRSAAVIETTVLRAIGHHALGDRSTGLEHLRRALALAEPEGYVRLFVDEGAPLRDLLRHAATAGDGGSYARRLLSAFEEKPGAAPRDAATAGLPEPLTAREVEILRLIAAGMRNQDIADQLVISVATVKRHIANGYGKMGVTHRTEAVARANELHLL